QGAWRERRADGRDAARELLDARADRQLGRLAARVRRGAQIPRRVPGTDPGHTTAVLAVAHDHARDRMARCRDADSARRARAAGRSAALRVAAPAVSHRDGGQQAPDWYMAR